MLVGTVAAAAVGVARAGDPVFGGTGPVGLAGVWGLYAATALLVARQPALVWGHDAGGAPAGVFAGGLAFGGSLLARLLAPAGLSAAVALGAGLGVFGFAAGHWSGTDTERARTTTPE